MKKFLTASGFLLFILVNVAGAASPLDLKTCLKLALARYPRLKALAARSKAYEARFKAAEKDLWPWLSWRYRYTRLRDRQKIVILGHDVPLSSYEMVENDLVLEAPLFHGLSLRIKKRLAALEADIARVEEKRGRQEIAFLVKKAYFSLLTAKHHLREARKSLDRLKAHLKIVKAYYEEGLVAKHQVLASEVALSEAEHVLILAKNRVKLAKSRLNMLLDRPFEAPLEVVDVLEHPLPVVNPLAYYQEEARRLRPELEVARMTCLKAREKIKLARAAYYPQLDLVAAYQRRGTDLLASQDPYWDRENFSVSFNLELLLWDWGKRKQEVAAARAEALAREALLRELEKEVSLEVEEAYLALTAAYQRLQVAKRALHHAQENFLLEKARFKEGLAESADVLDAEAFLAAAEARYTEALSDLHLSQARLLFAIGKDPLP